jgi:hypothetical protein
VELSVELLQATLSALRSDPMEQRRHPRAPVRAKVKIVPYKNGALDKAFEVWTRDISTGGIGIISTSPLPVSGKFVLRLPRGEGGPLYLLCTVKNCISQAKGVFVIGSTFAEQAVMKSTADPDEPKDEPSDPGSTDEQWAIE